MAVKNVAGYDMSRLQYGAMGTLGLITQVNLKLYPQPEASGALLAGFEQLAQAGQLIDQLMTSQLQPATMALLDGGLAQHVGLEGDTPHWLLARFDGRAAAVTRQLQDMEQWAADSAAALTRWDGAALANQWPILTDFAQLAEAEASALLRLATPASAVVEAVARAVDLSAAHGLAAQTLVDAANGIIWLKLAAGDKALADGLPRLHQELLQSWPQTVIAAAAPELKQNLAVWGTPPSAIDLMQRIRRTFDPQQLLNPGRFLV
jgi:glycolate oxidase FAD binding subunit